MSRTAAALLLACGCLESPPGTGGPPVIDSGPSRDGAAECLTACCPAGQLVDDFEGAPSGAFVAETTDEGCVVVEELGAVWLSNRAIDEACDYETTKLWRLTGESASVEVTVPGDGAPNVEFRTDFGDPGKYFFERNQAGLRVAHQLSGDPPVELVSSVFQPELHRFWRLRGDGAEAVLYFEVAGSDLEWDLLWQVDVPTGSTDCVEFELATRGLVGDDDDDRVAFDNFNTQ